MKYKVGDEVLVKCKIIGDLKDGRYKVTNSGNSRIVCETVRHLFPVEEEVYPVSKELDINAEEAWDIARRVHQMSRDELLQVFKTDIEYIVFKDFTPQQVKNKIEKWEMNKINIGDEVVSSLCPNDNGCKFFVTYINNSCKTISGVSAFTGETFSIINMTKVQKTGRHIDIDKILEQIGDTDA